MRLAEPWLWMAALLLAGCATPSGSGGSGGWFAGGGARQQAALFRDPALTVDSAARAITVGRSDKREVQERLGSAEVLAFEGGHEVWVYRAPEGSRGADSGELVILFGPRGVVAKVRARPAYRPPPSAR